MTTLSVRLPDDIHARMAAIAKSRHMSINAAIAQAAEQWVTDQVHDQLTTDAVDKVFASRGDLFDRLADA